MLNKKLSGIAKVAFRIPIIDTNNFLESGEYKVKVSIRYATRFKEGLICIEFFNPILICKLYLEFPNGIDYMKHISERFGIELFIK